MVRVAGMSYAIAPGERIGRRISDLRIGERPMSAERRYKVAGWAPVREDALGEPVWELVARHLRGRRTIPPLAASRPRLIGVAGNPGLSAA
jgi:S-sulfosulfanyl-L-cysteine sulfohydrolase